MLEIPQHLPKMEAGLVSATLVLTLTRTRQLRKIEAGGGAERSAVQGVSLASDPAWTLGRVAESFQVVDDGGLGGQGDQRALGRAFLRRWIFRWCAAN